MKKILSILILIAGTLYSQNISLSEPALVTAERTVTLAKVSPDGRWLAAGGENNAGLFLFSSNGSSFTEISEAPGAGWGFQWSPNSEKLAFRENVFVSKSSGIKSRISIYDISAKQFVYEAAGTNTGLPYWSQDGKGVLYFDETGMKKIPASLNPDPETYLISDNKLTTSNSVVNGAINSIINKSENYILNFSCREDNNYIAVEIASSGLYIINTKNGKILDLGSGESPVWMGNRFLVYMKVTDDGREILSSELICFDMKNESGTNLTAAITKYAFYPSVTIDGAIYYTDDSGRIFRAKLLY